jgi:YidC/Oxa1 family membrane protein insertase
MEKRLILFLILSFAIFYGSSYIFGKLYPSQPKSVTQAPAGDASPSDTASSSPSPASVAPAAPAAPPASGTASVAASSTTSVPPREIQLRSDLWNARLSNQGGVITEFVMTAFTDGKPIDAPTGVVLQSSKLSREVGAAFRFYIPSDSNLQNTLNQANFDVKMGPEAEIALARGVTRQIQFEYSGNGVVASKTYTFKGVGAEGSSGYEFDYSMKVTKDGAPVEVYTAIGPNFGDQNVTHVDVYKHAPQLTYAVNGSVYHESADQLKGTYITPTEGPVNWVAVDDNYFAMAFIPPAQTSAYRILNDGKYVSIALAAKPDEVNHIYAGPKDLAQLVQISKRIGLDKTGAHLEDLVSYGWLNFLRVLVHPIAQFMLKALRVINNITHNFGWSIVALTVLLNMLFFPLRWKSSVAMRRAAKMQPEMKRIQEKMKELDKNDPRMMDLQKEQLALMKEGNPLMGCLPLLLQMPFFMAVFAILTVSIEVRHAHFFGWLKDLSVADPFYILPILMCVTMIAQTALTPSTMDPVQKKVQYVMPVILTVAFFRTAPAGLVLYWMVSNLVGVAQQFIINKLNPPEPPTTTDSSTNNRNNKTGSKLPKGKKTKEALAS